MTEKFYYKSPIGILEIELKNDTIQRLRVVESCSKISERTGYFAEVVKQLDTKAGFHKLLEFIEMQGGRNFSNEHLKAREIYAPISGYIKKIYAEKLGTLVKEIGGGRENLQDQIDYEVGVVLNKKVGDFIQAGELLLTVYENKKIKKEEEYLACFEITEEKVEPLPLIYEIIK